MKDGGPSSDDAADAETGTGAPGPARQDQIGPLLHQWAHFRWLHRRAETVVDLAPSSFLICEEGGVRRLIDFRELGMERRAAALAVRREWMGALAEAAEGVRSYLVNMFEATPAEFNAAYAAYEAAAADAAGPGAEPAGAAS